MELLSISTYPVAAVTLPLPRLPPLGQLELGDARTASLLYTWTYVAAYTSPQMLLLFLVVTSDSENSAYLNDSGGALVMRRRRLACSAPALPTVPTASIW